MTRRRPRRPLAAAIAVLALAGAAGVVLAAATAGDVQKTLNEDDTSVAIDLTGTTTDTSATQITYTVISDPSHGALDEGSLATGSMPCATGNCTTPVHYTPTADYNGSDSFTYKTTDTDGDSNVATVTLTIDPVNDVPSFTSGGDVTVVEDSGAYSAGWATAISAGPADEQASQTVDFELTTDSNASLFLVEPAVAADGTLTFTPAANAFGSATVGFKVHDDGGTTNGGVDLSAEQTFTLTITGVNDAPSFTKGGNVTVLEDSAAYSAAWATNISAGPGETQTVSFQLASDTNASLFSTAPAVAANGTLTFTPAANAFGTATVGFKIHDNGGTANLGVDTSAVQTFTITLTGVNDAPSFTKGGDVTVLEDSGAYSAAWATGMSSGPGETQALSFQLSSDTNAALFSVLPAVASDGTLTFTPAGNAFGMATLGFKIHDSGGTTNGGVDTSAEQTFTLTITGVNDAPSFTAGANVTVLEDSGAYSAAWATGMSAGPGETQGLAFQLASDTNAALFSVAPAVASDGTLTFTPAANKFGTATVGFTLHDDGGTANFGVDTSAAQTFTITVTGVNDVPSFTKGANVTVLEDSAAYSAAWATAISPGPNEGSQTVSFQLASDTNPSLFSTAPAVSSTGTLTFTPAANAFGSATVGFKIHDNGGTANFGVDTSAAQTFTITITGVNDAPSFTVGPNEVVNHDSGAFTAAAWATAISAGPGETQTVTFSFTGDDNPTLFSVAPAVASDGTLTFTVAAGKTGTANLTLVAQDNGGVANGSVDTSSPPAAVSIRVNANPNAVNDTATVAENAAATVLDVLANDTSLPDPPETLTVTAVSGDSVLGPLHGTVTVTAGNGSVTYKPATGYYGSDFFRYYISDGFGGTDFADVFVTITKDTTAPTVGTPVETVKTVSTLTSTGLSAVVSWTGSDAGVGILRFEVQRSVNGGTFTNLTLSSPTAKSLAIGVGLGTKYQFRVRGVDKNGNTSAWKTGPTFLQARYQESSSFITYSTGWTQTSNSSDSGGGAKYATVSGKTATFTHTMRDVAIVVPRSASRGSFDVYVDGVFVRTINETWATTLYQQVIWQMHFSSVASHAIKVVVHGSVRIDLDCFVILT